MQTVWILTNTWGGFLISSNTIFDLFEHIQKEACFREQVVCTPGYESWNQSFNLRSSMPCLMVNCYYICVLGNAAVLLFFSDVQMNRFLKLQTFVVFVWFQHTFDQLEVVRWIYAHVEFVLELGWGLNLHWNIPLSLCLHMKLHPTCSGPMFQVYPGVTTLYKYMCIWHTVETVET